MSTVFRDRLPFAEAISDELLLGKPWKKLSLPQQVVLKIFYGLPLESDEELRLWAAFQGYGVYDELGYLQDVAQIPPYVPQEYDTLTGVIGRRAGKSDKIGGFIAAYEITLGGHTRYIEAGQDVFWLYIAQDLATAETNMKFVTLCLEQSPLLSKEITSKPGASETTFRNGITLRPEPPNIRTSRGTPVVGVTMDEFGFWYKDAKSANPDFEVVRAIEYALSQFPDAKQVRLSTPWTKEGLLYAASLHGTLGHKIACGNCPNTTPWSCTHMRDEREEFEGHLVVQAPTATMGNPRMTRKRLVRLRRRDAEAFERESLARFTDSQTSFLPHAAVERAIDTKVAGPRQFDPNIDYVACADPAFRHDSFTFTIAHNETARGVVQDYVKEWIPEVGERLNPAVILDEIAATLKEWKLDLLYSDQYQFEALQQLAIDRDISMVGIDLTTKSKSRIMGSLSTQVNQNRLCLLDNPTQTAQLKALQKTLGPAGYVSIAAPQGKKDDLATVLALAVSQAIQLPAYDNGAAAARAPRVSNIPQAELDKLNRQWAARPQDDEQVAAQMAYEEFVAIITQE